MPCGGSEASEHGGDAGWCFASRWHVPAKISRTREVAIECYPLTTGLDSQGGEPSTWDQVSAGIRIGAKAREDIPVPLARLNNNTVRLVKQYLTEAQHLVKAAGFGKHLRMGRDTDYAAEDLRETPYRASPLTTPSSHAWQAWWSRESAQNA